MTKRLPMELVELTELMYRRRQSEITALQAEERRLRAALSDIAKTRASTRQADRNDPVRQSIGADIAWQAWLDARQRELSMELARLLARKEPAEHRLRTAFGRDQVARALAKPAKGAGRDRSV